MTRKKRPRLVRAKAPYVPSIKLLYRLVRVDEATSCHVWTGVPSHNGYGRIGINYKDYLAHRLSYELQVGPIPEGLFVCHTCDNRLCINPQHLFLGTLQDNHADMVSKGRQQKGESHYRAMLTADAVKEIRCCGKPDKEMAHMLGVSKSAIKRVRSGKVWRHVT